jgi:23S rRNA pseudouridine2605 synthase
MRINRFLAKCGLGSRRKCEQYIINGKIAINGKICTNLAYIVGKNDAITFEGKPIKVKKTECYYKFYKPLGVVTSMSDDLQRKDITHFLKLNNIKERVFPIGRLDSDSEGLIILTTDGKLAHRVAHPKYEIDKKYIVKIKGKLDKDKIYKLENGIALEEGITSKCKVSIIKESEKTTTLEIILHQGWKRQIRRMIEQVGSLVISLKRVSIGNINLGNLKEGEIQSISLEEIEKLKKLLI